MKWLRTSSLKFSFRFHCRCQLFNTFFSVRIKHDIVVFYACLYSWYRVQSVHPSHPLDSSSFPLLQGGADKSLARPTSRCLRTEWLVSLEREVCSYAELQFFSFYRGWKEAFQATRAISTTSRREVSPSFFFPARQGAEGNSHYSVKNIRGKCIILCHRQQLGDPV